MTKSQGGKIVLKLRNFLYINDQLLDDYLSAIDGFSYEEETRTERNATSKQGELNAGIPVFSGKGSASGTAETETQKTVKLTQAAKFQRVFEFLENNELKYYEFMDEATWTGILREDFIEVLINIRFSKMKELVNTIEQLEALSQIVQPFVEQTIIDAATQQKINAVKGLGVLDKENEITSVFSFENTKDFQMIAYLDEKYFKVSQDNFVGSFYVLCKIQRKISKGEKIELGEVFESLKNIPMNRAQKRNMPKNINTPAEIKDVIKGPAAVVIPVAIYR